MERGHDGGRGGGRRERRMGVAVGSSFKGYTGDFRLTLEETCHLQPLHSNGRYPSGYEHIFMGVAEWLKTKVHIAKRLMLMLTLQLFLTVGNSTRVHNCNPKVSAWRVGRIERHEVRRGGLHATPRVP